MNKIVEDSNNALNYEVWWTYKERAYRDASFVEADDAFLFAGELQEEDIKKCLTVTVIQI